MLKIRNIIAGIIAITAVSFGGAIAQDSTVQLEQKIQKEILRLPRYELFDYITFEVKGDTVYLDGKVKNAVNKNSAENIIEDMDGVSKVVNNIEVLPLGSFDDSIRRSLVRSISRTANMSRYISYVNPPVRLIVDGGHITLEGIVGTDTDRDLMYIAARSVPNVFSVTNNLKVTSEIP